MQVTVSAANMQMTVFIVIDKFTIIIVFIVIMQMRVSVARWGHLGFLERGES